MKAIIIDDEENNIINLQHLLAEYCSGVRVAAKAQSAEEGKQVIFRHQPDLLFLDIQMPGKTGFDLLQSLPDMNFEVIFITAYDKYGIQAVKFAAVDYLLKPINIEELQQAVANAQKKQAARQHNRQLENLVHLLQHRQEKATHRLALATQKETRFVHTGKIVYCESINNYTHFFLDNGEKLLVSKPIYEYEELLKPYAFVRCHQSFVVNVHFIKSWVKEDGGYLLLETGDQVPVSKSKRDALLKAIEMNGV